MNIWDISQQSQINSANRDAGVAANKASRAEVKVDGLQHQIDHLTLLCQSMWELLRDHTGLSDSQLRARIADVDTRDGRADGRIRPTVFSCPACGANCNSARQTCSMCGEDLKKHKPHLFEA